MASKVFFFLIAACMAQVLGQPQIRPQPIKKTPELMKAFFQMNNVGKVVALKYVETSLKQKNNKAFTCYESQRKDFESFCVEMSEKIDNAAKEVRRNLDVKYKENRDVAYDRLRRLAGVMNVIPFELKNPMLRKDYASSIKGIKDFRKRFETNLALFIVEMNKIRKISKEDAEKAEKTMNELRDEMLNRGKEFETEFDICLGNF